MRLTHESPRARWLIMAAAWTLAATLLLLHTRAARDHLALVDAQGLRGAAEAGTPLRRVCPALYADAQMWVRHALALQEDAPARVRFTAADNAPDGREVHWNSAFAWAIAGAGALRHAATGEPLPLATERALAWFNCALLLALTVGFSTWVARRAGAGAGLLVALGMIGHRDFYDGFSPGYVDHHGLLTTAVFGVVLGAAFMGGGWWRAGEATPLLPTSRESVRRAAVFSALCGAVGVWISAASVIPAIAITGCAGLAAVAWLGRAARDGGAEFDAGAWRLWGRVGAGASLAFYLLEYAPAHFGWRLEVNHPLYALAWWGGAELVALLAEWRLAAPAQRPAARRFLAPALAVSAVPVLVLALGARVFVLRDPFLARLTDTVLEGMSLPTLVRALGWDIFFTHVNASLLPVPLALALLLRRGRPDKITVGFALLATLAFLALAFWQVRWWVNTAGPQLCLTLVVLAALAREWRPRARWLLVLGTAGVLFLPPAISRVIETQKLTATRALGRLDLIEPLYRDVAAALRASQPAGDLVVLASPDASTGIGYYGRFRTVGTLYWENLAGLKAAAAIFSAPSEDEARTLIRARGLTHLAMISDANFLAEYFRLLRPQGTPAEFAKTFGRQLLVEQRLPAWLRVLPYRAPADLALPGLRVLLLQVAFDQPEHEAIYHVAAAQLANGEPALAEQAFNQAIERAPAAARAPLCLSAGNLCYQHGARAAAARLYRAGLALGDEVNLARNLAWLLATDPDPAVRSAPEALTLAERTLRARPDEPASANTLAAALAENGRWAEAVEAATHALAQARATGDAAVIAQFERRLASYRAGKPWRQ